MKPISETLLIRITGNYAEEIIDQVATEAAFTIVVNDEVLVSLLCSPVELDAMAVGFLLSEGLLKRQEALKSVVVDLQSATVFVNLDGLEDNWQDVFNKKTITSGCGKGITFTDPKNLQDLAAAKQPIHLTTDKLKELLTKFKHRSDLFIKTGGVHSAALTDGRDILLFSEDIGRHNAVDKLIGKAFMQNIDLHDKILLSSGRISGEIMTKVVRNQIPVLISRTAPTCMSISFAEDHGITMIGFARGNRMNIYSRPLGVVFDNLINND